MQTKHIAILVVVGLAIGGVAFYGGMQVAKAGVNPSPTRSFGGAQGQRGQGAAFAPGGRNAGGVTNGQILSKDATSLTVKLRDGGSKIVFYSASTTVSKMTDGSMADVTQDTNVMIMGTPNADGSLTAQSVQLRPIGEMRPPTAQ
jgi:hypothetical protein